MKKLAILAVMIMLPIVADAQKRISLYASDSLEITADLYKFGRNTNYAVFFHQAGSSRGEFKEIAPRFLKMGYNVLAVDLRSGNESNYIQNQTAYNAIRHDLPREMIDARLDIEAAVDYALKAGHNKPVLVFGSSYSASLALEAAANDSLVSAVIAFSPGEYFRGHSVKDSISGLSKPFFVAGTQLEEEYVRELLSLTDSNRGVVFIPEDGQGRHGASALWKSNNNSSEYWLALVMFVKSLSGSD